MWLCIKLYCIMLCVVIFLLFTEGLLNVSVFKTVFIYVVCSDIIIVYRRDTECGCV